MIRTVLFTTLLLGFLAASTGCASDYLAMKSEEWKSLSPDARREAVIEIGHLAADGYIEDSLRPLARERLEGELGSDVALVRAAAVRALARGWKADAFEKVSAMTSDEKKEVRRIAVQELGNLGLAESVGPLSARLENENICEIRVEIVRALQKTGSENALPVLVESLEDYDPGVQFFAAEALGAITGQSFGQNKRKWKKWWENRKTHGNTPSETPGQKKSPQPTKE